MLIEIKFLSWDRYNQDGGFKPVNGIQPSTVYFIIGSITVIKTYKQASTQHDHTLS